MQEGLRVYIIDTNKYKIIMKKYILIFAAMLVALTAQAESKNCGTFELLADYLRATSSTNDTIRITNDITARTSELNYLYDPGITITGAHHTLDLNGHSIEYIDDEMEFGYINGIYGHKYGTVILPLFQVFGFGKLSIIDTQENGKIICRCLNPMQVRLPTAVAVNSMGTLNLYGGRLEGRCSDWQHYPTDCGIYTSDTWATVTSNLTKPIVNIYDGLVTRIIVEDSAYININGGEIGNIIVAPNTPYYGNGNPITTYERIDNGYFKFNSGIIRGICGLANVDNLRDKNIVAKYKQYSVNDITVTHEAFITAMAASSANNKVFQITTGDYCPITVNDVAFTTENQADMLGDGTVSYDDATKTLTLTNAQLYKITMNGYYNNASYIIKLQGNSRITGSGITMNDAHLVIHGTQSDSLHIFGAGCAAITMNNDKYLDIREGCYVSAKTSGTYAVNGGYQVSVLASSFEAVSGGSTYKAVNTANGVHAGTWTEWTVGDSNAAALKIEFAIPLIKIWIAGQQLNLLNIYGEDYNPIVNDRISGEIKLTRSGNYWLLDLRNVTINAYGLREADGSISGAGVPAVRIEEDSVKVYVHNTVIYSGDSIGVKLDGYTFWATGGKGMLFDPTDRNECQHFIYTGSNGEPFGEKGSLNITSYMETSISGYRLSIINPSPSDMRDSIVFTGRFIGGLGVSFLTIDGSTINFGSANMSSQVAPTLTNCYIGSPACGIIRNSTPFNIRTYNNYGASNPIIYNSQDDNHLLPVTLLSNDESMGSTNNAGMDVRYGNNYHLAAFPLSGYKFKHWKIKEDGIPGYTTTTTADTIINIRAATKAIAYFEPIGGETISYNVWVNDVEVTNQNCMDPLGDNKVTYSNVYKHLTLNNVNWNIDAPALMVNPYSEINNINIDLIGKNNIKGETDWSIFFAQNINTVKFIGDSLYVGLHTQGMAYSGIKFSNKMVMENRYTKVSTPGIDDIAIAGDTLVIQPSMLDGQYIDVILEIEGNVLLDTIIIPENYMIYPEGAYFSQGQVHNQDASIATSFRIAPQVYIPSYTITAVADDSQMGTVTGGGSYTEGTEVTLTATPNDGYQFVKWSNGSTDNPFIAQVYCDAQMTAYFILSTNTVETVKAEDNVYVWNKRIFGTENMRIYTIHGIDVTPLNGYLWQGVYIVVYNNKATKVIVQ